MGLRCILGHDYDGPKRAETREERGDERVITVREYRECTRCGHQQVISENTEIRSTEVPGSGEPSEVGNQEPVEDQSDPGAGRSDQGDSGSESEVVSATEDDGVILEDDEEPTRQPGEWPEAEQETAEDPGDHDEWPDDHREMTTEEADHERWPTPEGDDEGFDAVPSSGGPDESVDFGGGLNPDRTGEPIDAEGETIEGVAGSGDDSAPSNPGETSDARTGIRRSDPGPSPTTQQRPANPDTEFVCPNCDHTAPAHESSLRPGDICPECNRGYLTERDDA